MGEARDLGRLGLHASKEGGVLHEDRRDVGGEPGPQRAEVQQRRRSVDVHLVDREIRPEIVEDPRPFVTAHRGRDQHAAAPGEPARHPERRRGGLEPVVRRHVHDVHLQELAHHRGVLEQGLEAAVILVRVAGVRGQELGPAVDLVADRRDVVRVAARAEEAQNLARGAVAVEQALHVPGQLRLGPERCREVQRPAQPQRWWNVGVELVDGGRPDGREHLRPDVRDGVRDVRMVPASRWSIGGQSVPVVPVNRQLLNRSAGTKTPPRKPFRRRRSLPTASTPASASR